MIHSFCDELINIDDNECMLVDTHDLISCWCYLLVSFDAIDKDFIVNIYEAVNELKISDLKTMSESEICHVILKAVHKKLFPKSAINEEKIELELKEYFDYTKYNNGKLYLV